MFNQFSFMKKAVWGSWPDDTYHTVSSDLDGSTEYFLRSTLSDYNVANAWSVSLRFKPDALAGNKWLTEFWPSSWLVNRIGILARWEWWAPYDQIRIDLWNSSGSKFKEYQYAWVLTAWTITNAIFTRDGTTLKWYMDGVLDSSPSTPTDNSGTMTNTNRRLSLGASWWWGAPFDWLVSRRDMWNTTLTADEVTSLYYTGTGYGIDLTSDYDDYASSSSLVASHLCGKNPSNVWEDYAGSNDLTWTNVTSADTVTFA